MIKVNNNIGHISSLHLDTLVNRSNATPEVTPGTSILVSARREASITNHLRKLFLWREFADGFDEVLVGVAVASKDGPHERDYIE